MPYSYDDPRYRSRREQLRELQFQAQGERERARETGTGKKRFRRAHRGILAPVRVVAMLTVLSALSVQLSALGATIVGNVEDILGYATRTNITFRPHRNGPLSLTTGLVLTDPKTITNNVDGSFSVALERGDYVMQVGANTLNRVFLSVPSTNGTYSLASRISEDVLFAYEYDPASVSMALGDAADANFVNLTNGQAMVWNSAAERWTNVSPQVRAGTNVTVSTNGPLDFTVNSTASGGSSTNNLVFLLTFEQTNGVGSNVVAAATPKIGRFLHATREAANPPNALVPMITNSALTYQPISNAGTIYIAYSAVGTIDRVRMLFRMRETYGNGTAVSPLVHIVGNGEYVAASDLFTHGGFTPQFGTVAFDGHLGGYNGASPTQPTVSVTNPELVWWPLQDGLGQLNVFEYWRDGTNVSGHVNGWPFTLPYTNAAVFTNQTNLIVQFYAPGGNALSGRNPEIVSIEGYGAPYGDTVIPDGMNNPTFYNASLRRFTTNYGTIVNVGATTNRDVSVITWTNGNATSLALSTLTNRGTIQGVGNNTISGVTAITGSNVYAGGLQLFEPLQAGVAFSNLFWVSNNRLVVNAGADGFIINNSGNTSNWFQLSPGGHWRTFLDGTNAGNVTVASNLTAGSITLAPGGTLNLEGDNLSGTWTNRGTNLFGLFTDIRLSGRTTNDSVITNSQPITFPTSPERAWLTGGNTNTGFGFNQSTPALYNGGTVVARSFNSGNQMVFTLMGGFNANSQSYYALSQFGPRWVEEQWTGRMMHTNAGSSGPLTNRLYGIMEFANITGGSNTYTGGAIVYASNGELRVADASGNHTTISPHAKDSPGATVDEGLVNPIVFKHENAYLGETEWLHLSAMARELETLTGKRFVFAVTNAPRDWRAEQQSLRDASIAERQAIQARIQAGETNLSLPAIYQPIPEPDRIRRLREDRGKKR